ncbi:MAG: FxsA family protein [Thiovulaceae bacterium]|nr:FxsA family protein [Sulfurimonadaceae bacterium]MDD3817153.1 FxsA family protein [Sulfurimonadaceae bacterium]
MIYFLLYLFAEVLVSVAISSAIGGLATFFEILLSAFVGISILVNFRKTLKENLDAVSYNCIDIQQFHSLNLFTLLGAVLLIIPGFLTDIVGILMQFSAVTTMIVNRYSVKSKNSKTKFYQTQKDSDVIDVEIISDSTSLK